MQVNIATGKNHPDFLTGKKPPILDNDCQRHRATRFDNDFHAFPGEEHGVDNLRFAGHQYVFDVTRNKMPGEGS